MKHDPNILLIEDSEDDALLLLRELKLGGFSPNTKRVETGEALREALETEPWDLVISDYTLPKLGAPAAIEIINGSSQSPPVIVVSGKIGEEAAVEVMKAGASDYITKNGLSRLAPAVERELRESEVRRARLRAEEENLYLNQILQTIFEINKMIVRETDKDRLLSETCRILVEHGRFRMAWVGMVDPDSCALTPVASAGYDEDYLKNLDIKAEDSSNGKGPSGSSIRLGTHSICHDIVKDDRFIPWRQAALDQGYRSSAAFPLRVRGEIVGNINVYSSETNSFGEKMVFLLEDLAGDIGYALQAIDEAAERRRAEEALRDSNERFRQLFEQNEDALMLLKGDLCGVIDSNPAATGLYGFSREDNIERCCRFLEGEDKERFHGILTDAFEKGTSGADRIRAKKKDGTEVVVSARAKKIRLRDDFVILCTFRDMTQIIRMEEEAKDIQAKLFHANKMSSLGILASGVAHEINNPNNFIMFNSALLTDAWKDASKILDSYYSENGDFLVGGLPFSEMKSVMPELLSGISDGSRRIKNIIDNLKDFSRTDTSGVEEGTFDVNKAVKASAEILSNQINKYTDNFHLTLDSELPPVKGSLQKIEQVVINLILNSLQALPDRKRRVWLTTSREDTGRMVVVEVKDEGSGIPEDLLERVTEPFFTTKSHAGGTGLGLSISYSIVNEHRGSLEFSSRPGEGTTATIKLPVA